jgi:hypothetical protein
MLWTKCIAVNANAGGTDDKSVKAVGQHCGRGSLFPVFKAMHIL